MPSALAQINRQQTMEYVHKESDADCHLRSIKEVTGYRIEALDGTIGHVEDFLIDEETWAIRYMIVDTKNWWPGKKILVSPTWIKNVSWIEKSVTVELTKDNIEQGPQYDPNQTVTREYEDALYTYYGKAKYWS